MSDHLPNNNSFGFLLTDVSRLFRQTFEKAIMEAGIDLTPGEVRALAHVARAPGSRQATIAERMGVEPMTLSAYLDRLESRRLINRETDPSDRRAKIVTLTDESEEVFKRVQPVAEAIYRQTVDGIDPAVQDAVGAALARMRGNLASSDPLLRQPWSSRAEHVRSDSRPASAD
ncbi:MarR family winged helix-turn-helix transcriptional regulator [Consotaella salsifontis]|uniref:DNA-binding transcriptional regulator, MarR family n=1 Tax=Consotaella salsifontis TaxID=1365950 RepID=A0A1T4RYR9_9HYPH|nr:MarR family transcriptional regulator [Consotaella salsifontis]SKA20848.1 DNA-binding transcriptional regulator, MarR family [Consotaella salsifontis]